jgi:hypothetical protein
MTFKHTKNWDSEVMRSLEKVAYQKGLIKPEPLPQKTASVIKKADVTPTSDLMANIFKLCVALRAEGFIKEANDVEVNYLNYKRAQTLYEAFKEKGEDVIHDAHSEGSHKMEDVDSDEAVFEDILDKHDKIMKAVEKRPTGKLSSNKDILNAVKVTLGAAPLARRKDKSSDPRSYLSTKTSLGQEAVPKSDSSGSGIGGAAAGVGAILTIQQAIRILNNWRVGYNIAKAEKAIEFLIKMAPKNPTALRWVITTLPRLPVAQSVPAAAEAVATVTKIAGPAAEKILLETAGETAARGAAGAVAETAVPAAAEAGVAAEAGGMGSWLSGIGESAWAGLTTPIGTVGAEGVSMVGGAGGAAAAGGAIAAGGILGMIIGNALFNSKYNIKDVMEAGERIISDLDDEDSNLNSQDKIAKAKFASTLSKLKILMPQKDKLLAGATKDDVMNLVRFNDLLSTSTQQAQAIWSYAQGHQDEQTFGFFRGFSTIKIHASNYIKVAGELRDLIINALQEFRGKAEEQMKQRSATTGGGDKLVQGYQDALSTISKYNAIIKAKRLPNAEQLGGWLESMRQYLGDEVKEFSAVDPVNRAAVAKEYITRLKAATDRLDAFQKALPQ